MKCPYCDGCGMLEPESLGQTLRILRTARGERVSDLAKIIGCTQGYVSEMERNKKVPTTNRLIAIADHYGVTLDCLMGREP